MCLIARHLEANGIPTLALGSARDILAAGRPPRAVFVDYPLGHTAGKPFDHVDQRSVIRAALAGFSSLQQNDGILSLDNQWGSEQWRIEAGASQGDDTRQPRDETPQFQLPEDRDAAVATGAIA